METVINDLNDTEKVTVIISDLKNTDREGVKVNGLSQIPLIKGESAYDIAVLHGYVGTEEEWLESMKYDDTEIKKAVSNKVDKIDGKELSSNDFTTEEKDKLAKLENYVLPPANQDTLGGIIPGENLSITESGVLNAKLGSGAIPSGGEKGQVLYKETDNDYDIGWTDELSSKYLKGNGRISSADVDHIYNNSDVYQRLDISSDTMTTNKPAGDGFINTYSWDNTGKYDTQLYIPNASTVNGGRPQIRFNDNKDTWTSWKSLALYADTENKTNTSVFPNNSGHIKSKYRVATRGYTAGDTWYYPLCKLPIASNSNASSATIRGRIGGWTDNDMSSLYAMMWNRMTTGITLLDLAGNLYQKTQTIQNIWDLCDVVIYKNSDNSDTVYLKCKDYFCFDLDLELFQDSTQILYDGSYLTSEPSGTLSAQASTTNERMELYNSALHVDGNKVLTSSDIIDNLTSTSTANALSANQGRILNNKMLDYETILEW